MNETKIPRQENLAAGIVGALLGSLLGAACIVFIGQLGYVAALSGLVMAVCALKGYEKFGGVLSKKGIVICCVIILAMTYFGNKMDWALSASQVLDMGFMECYRSISLFIEEEVIEASAYWGNLAMLYVFTLVGAVPTIISALRGPADCAFTGDAATPEQLEEAAGLTVYSVERKWTRPHMVSTVFCAFAPMLFFLMLMFTPDIAADAPVFMLASLFLVLALMIISLFLIAPFTHARSVVYVRRDRTLWRVDLVLLNRQHGYRFVPSINTTPIWFSLSADQQAAAKRSILQAILTVEREESSRVPPLSRAVTPLKDLQVVQNGSKAWTVQYETPQGATKKLKIPKLYRDFAPSSDLAPLEKGAGAHLLPFLVLLCSFLPLVSLVLPGSSALSSTTQYDLDTIHFSLDSRMEEDIPGIYVDPKTDTTFYVYPTVYEAQPEQLRPYLQTQLDELDSTVSQRSHEFITEEGQLEELEGPDGKTYLYDGFEFAATDGTMVLCYAVYLPEQSAAVVTEALFDDSDSIEDVKDRMFAMMRTITVDSDTQTLPLAEPVELTDENYQTFFAPAQEYGYEYVGRGFMKAPAGMFEDASFVDSFLPYGPNPMYSEDGTVISSSAHGIEMMVFMTQNDGTAGDVVQELAKQTALSNDEELVGELVFDEELNVAIWVSAHTENGKLAPRLFYADVKQPGCYLAAVFTYHPDEADEFTDALIEELSDAYSLVLPEISVFDTAA